MNYVINPLSKEELSSFLDTKSKEIIKYFIVKSLFSQPEPKMGQKTLPIQVPKEHIEQWFTQSFDVKPVGAGSYPIDIYNERENWGADIKMLNIKLNKKGEIAKGDSGEASLGQKFGGPGVNLDKMFELGDFEEIKNQWVILFRKKYESLTKEFPIEKIYYFFILRPSSQTSGADFYFTGAILNVNKLEDVSVDTLRTTKKSVFLSNFIDAEFGNTKIYKAKKRLELRLTAKKWIDEGKSIKITTSFTHSHVDLRKENVGPEYLEKEIDKIKGINIKFEV